MRRVLHIEDELPKFCGLLRDVGLAFSVSEDGGPALLVSLRKAGRAGLQVLRGGRC